MLFDFSAWLISLRGMPSKPSRCSRWQTLILLRRTVFHCMYTRTVSSRLSVEGTYINSRIPAVVNSAALYTALYTGVRASFRTWVFIFFE